MKTPIANHSLIVSNGNVFTSTLERWLWLAAALVIVTVYATLAFAPAFANELRERELLDSAFIMGFGLLVLAIAVLALRSRPSIAELAAVLGVAGVYVIAFARFGIPEERTHLFEYGLLGALVYQALAERRSNGKQVRGPALIAATLTASLGIVDEGIQWLLPNRVFDMRDVGFNIGAAVVAIVGSAIVAGIRTRRQRREPSV